MRCVSEFHDSQLPSTLLVEFDHIPHLQIALAPCVNGQYSGGATIMGFILMCTVDDIYFFFAGSR